MSTPTVAHLFSGLGGGALGFARAGFRSLAAVDFDADACADLEYLTGERATRADLRTLSPGDLNALTDGETPDVIFTSPPCKGFSGCLPAARAASPAYQALNSLALRGVWLALEAWARPPPLIVLENVPRILTRGRVWIEQITALLHSYGYAVATSTHDCGEIGGLAQRRRRLLLVARHIEQAPALLREPPSQRVRTVGDELARLPMPKPGSSGGGPMHALPKLTPKNWLRLALIPAGGDWRDLPERVEIVHTPRRGSYGVLDWARPATTVKAAHATSNASSSVADPRVVCSPRPESWGVQPWAEHAHTIRAMQYIQTTRACVDDPRPVEAQAIISADTLVGMRLDVNGSRPTHLVIRAADGAWHRPMTVLELAVLQGFPSSVRGAPLDLAGISARAWRARIGNAVPPPAAEAIARECAACIKTSRSGFTLSAQTVWVSPNTSPLEKS